MKKTTTLRCLAVAATLFCASGSSQAALIYGGALQDSGSGFGTVNTILTLNNTAGVSSGSVVRSGGADVATGDAQPGATHNATYSFGELNVTSADQIRIILNAAEPGGANNSINLDALTLSIYSDLGGAALFSTSLAGGQFFATTQSGIGSVGYAFILDASSARAAQAFLTSTNRIGLSSSLSLASGGLDTFLVSVTPGGTAPAASIPEPASVALLGLGLAGMALGGRRKRARR